MNEQFEGLAKAIFDDENSGPGCPTAIWGQQHPMLKDRYIVAAMAARLIVLGPVYQMEMVQAMTGTQEPEHAGVQAQPPTPKSEDDPRNPNEPS